MKTILYNPIFINPQAYYVFPRLTRYLQPDNESTAEPANYIGTIEVKVIAYGDTTLKRTYTNTDSIDLSEFKNTWIRISLFTKVGSCVLGEWKIGNMESDLPYIDPEVLASLKAVVIVGNKTNNDSDRAIVKNLVDASNPFVISNASYNLNSGYGKYNITFQHFPYRENIISINDNKVVFDKGGQLLLPYPSMDRDIPSFKVKVSGLSGTYHFRYYYRDSNGAQDSINMAKDGIYELPICYNVQSSSDGTNCGFANNGSDIVTIEQVPEFQGAFVTDGVNDVITSTKTVLEMLGETNEITVVSMIHQITLNSRYNIGLTNYIRSGVTGNSGPYLRSLVTDTGKTGIYGYTAYNLNKNIDKNSAVINNILGDKNDYFLDTNNDYILDDSLFSVQNFVHRDGSISDESSSIAWYWTVIANKVLTTDQINQVIAYYNLDRTLKPDILCNTIKQGITNENHAEFGDKLIDYSGNGRDIQLNNIAWKGDSGIGKYSADFESFDWAVNISQKQHNKATISLNGRLCNHTAIEVDEMKVNIIGNITELIYWYIANPDDTTRSEIRLTSGINTLPKSYAKDDGQTYNIGFAYISGDSEITIEQIPSHAGALCLDGVNDFGKVTGMPIYKDYTVVADYIRTSTKEDAQDSPILSKSQVVNNGAFVFNYLNINSALNSYSFGANNGLGSISDSERKIYYQSKYVNDGKSINSGTGIDYNSMWLGTYRDNVQTFFNGAIYSLMSFPYSMSEFLIERQLKKHKLGTLYPNMVEFRPIVKSNSEYQVVDCYIDPLPAVVGNYYPINSKLRIAVTTKGAADEVTSLTVNGVSLGTPSVNGNRFTFKGTLPDKSPQKINITIDEYIRYEDIVQPYPVLLRFNDENGNEVSWGGKFRVGSTITRIGSAADSNLLPNIYNIFGLLLNDNQVTSSKVIVEKTMVFKAKSAYIFDNNEPNCILSPRLLRIPNSSYKILGYIPDISGHGNHGKINNSAYAEGSGVNEDGSYQFDGVDDFVTIPTTVGGKQVLMKVNWQKSPALLYDQGASGSFAVLTTLEDDAVNPRIAYQARNQDGKTYIDGIENNNIETYTLKDITHNITIANSSLGGIIVPVIGCNTGKSSNFAKMSLYDFMLFDNISTDDKIKELNEYVGIEAKVELPPYYWDAYGKTNLDEDKDTIQQRGVAEGDYDITNYNHAYDKMSGYGGYEFAKFDNVLDWYLIPNNNHIDVVSRNGYEITLKNLSTSVYGWYFQNSRVIGFITRDIPFKVKANKSIRVYWDMHSYKISSGEAFGHVVSITTLNPNEDTSISLRHLTEEELVELDTNKDRMYYLLWFDLSTLAVDEEVTIEMLPLYPNGLVYDGVTDYSENANIPALTDYTYILKRQILKGIANSAVMYKGNITVNQGGAFICNYCEPSDINLFTDFSFGGLLRSNDIDKPIIYGTKTSVNGDSITPGENIDTVGINVGKWVNYLPMVFYKLILYPKTIPLLQINFLKNLMERDEIIDLTNPIFIQ